MEYRGAEKISLGIGKTPIHKLENISRDTGVEIYLKRDDLNGLGMGGNKLRKLEYLLGEAGKKGATVLLTYGGPQTNHGRMTAAVAARAGMKSCIIVKGPAPDKATGNILLDKLMGCRLVFVDDTHIKDEADYEDRLKNLTEEATARVVEEYESEGERVYIVPMGGSSELGALGYVDARMEIEEQIDEMGIEADYIVTAYGSVGTYGGLLIGNKVLGSSTRVLGINILHDLKDGSNILEEHCDYIRRTARRFALKADIDIDDMLVADGVGSGYNMPEDRVYAGVERLARREGIILDFCYTGKAFTRMLEMIESGEIERGSRVIFIHTGGAPGIFSDIHTDAIQERILPDGDLHL